MTKPVVGFIGLGLMGGNMVECLQKNGFEPLVMDLNQDAVDAVVARGATKAESRPKSWRQQAISSCSVSPLPQS